MHLKYICVINTSKVKVKFPEIKIVETTFSSLLLNYVWKFPVIILDDCLNTYKSIIKILSECVNGIILIR